MSSQSETVLINDLPADMKPDLELNPDDAAGASRRQHKRYPTNWPAYCEALGAGGWAVTIINASEGGFGLSRDLPVETGAELNILIHDVGMFPCALVWKRNGKCGVRLLHGTESISDDQMAGLATGLASIRG